MKSAFLLVAALLCPASAAMAADAAPTGTVVVGMVNDQSGPNKAAGRGMRIGTEAYFKAVNALGGVNGRQIEFVFLDDAYVPDKTVDGVLKLIEEKKPIAVAGTVGTSNGVSILPVVKEYKVPFVNPRSGAVAFRSPVIPEVINIRASHQQELDAIVDYFVKESGAKRFSVFYQNDEFGLDVLGAAENALKRHNLTLVSKGSYERLTTAVTTGLTTIMEGKPDVILMGVVSKPGGAFIKEARKEGVKAHLATGSFGGGSALIAAAGPDAEGLVMSQVVPNLDDLSVPITKECKEAIEKNPDDSGFNVITFEGCIVAKTIVEALKGAGDPPTREGLLKAYEAMKGLDIGGLSLTLGPEDHQALDRVWLAAAKGGKTVSLPATRP